MSIHSSKNGKIVLKLLSSFCVKCKLIYGENVNIQIILITFRVMTN